jgi:hypothetical protein
LISGKPRVDAEIPPKALTPRVLCVYFGAKNKGVHPMKLSKSDLITVIEIARIALEYDYIAEKIAHELDLSEEECDRIYSLIEIKENENV